MAHCYFHALASVKAWGGMPADYQPLHDWFDHSKAACADFRHRALRHHAEGIFELERTFGTVIVNSDGRTVPVRLIGEQHVLDDLGRIPTFADWMRAIRPEPWMLRGQRLAERLALNDHPTITRTPLRRPAMLPDTGIPAVLIRPDEASAAMLMDFEGCEIAALSNQELHEALAAATGDNVQFETGDGGDLHFVARLNVNFILNSTLWSTCAEQPRAT